MNQSAKRAANTATATLKAKHLLRPIPLHGPDRYDERPNAGSALAEAIVAWQVPSQGGTMPVPPGRKGA